MSRTEKTYIRLTAEEEEALRITCAHLDISKPEAASRAIREWLSGINKTPKVPPRGQDTNQTKIPLRENPAWSNIKNRLPEKFVELLAEASEDDIDELFRYLRFLKWSDAKAPRQTNKPPGKT